MLFYDINKLLNTIRHANEYFFNLESRVLAQVAHYGDHGTSIGLHNYMKELLLIANANIPEARRVSVMSS